MSKHKYIVGADYVHAHKDSSGEVMENLDYEEARILFKEMKAQNKKYKNVFMEKDEE